METRIKLPECGVDTPDGNFYIYYFQLNSKFITKPTNSLSDDEDEEMEEDHGESPVLRTPSPSPVEELPPIRTPTPEIVQPRRRVLCQTDEKPVIRKVRKVIKKKSDSEKKKGKRRIWVREANLDRNVSGYFVQTFEKIKENDREEFFQHTRMTRDQYDNLLNMVKSGLTKKSMRPSIGFECRLAITLWYLSQGLTHQHIADTFKAGKSSIREIILETCCVIWNVLAPLYVAEPTIDEYLTSSNGFNERHGIPNCVGGIDEKYFNITCPPRKGIHKDMTMTLLAVSDSDYCFSSVDVELYDGESSLASKLLNDELQLPEDCILPESDIEFPHYFVANANFPLKRHTMRPYPEKLLTEKQIIFNRKLSKVHRVLENSLGILVARWKVLQTVLHYLPQNAKMIILATIALHNYIRKTSFEDNSYCPEGYVDWEDEDGNLQFGDWRKEVTNFFKSSKVGSNNATKTALALRDQLAEYFFKEEQCNFMQMGEAVKALLTEL